MQSHVLGCDASFYDNEWHFLLSVAALKVWELSTLAEHRESGLGVDSSQALLRQYNTRNALFLGNQHYIQHYI